MKGYNAKLARDVLEVSLKVDSEKTEEPMNKTSKKVEGSEIDCQTSVFQFEELVNEEQIPIGEQNVDEVA